MESAHLQAVRGYFEAIAAEDLDGLLELCDPDISLVSILTPAEGGLPYLGHEGMRAWWTAVFSDWDEYRLTLEQSLQVGDHVLALCVMRARGRASGAPVERPIAAVFSLRSGRAVRIVSHGEPADALLDLERQLRQR